MSKKNILMILDNEYCPDVRVKKEIETLIKNNLNVDLFCWDRTGSYDEIEKKDNFTIYRIITLAKKQLGYRQILNLFRFYYKLYFKIINNIKKYDAIHAHDFRSLVIAVLLKKKLNIPLVYDAHEIFSIMESHKFRKSILNFVAKFEIKIINKYVDVFITVSDQRKKQYWQKNGVMKHVYIVGNWYNPIKQYSKDKIKEIKLYLQIPENVKVISYIGSIHPGRDLISFCKFLEINKDIFGIIAGDGSDNTINRVKEFSDNNSNINYLGYITNPNDIYQISDYLIYLIDDSHPYSYWIAPNNIFKSIAHRRPIISIDRGEALEIFNKFKIGHLVEDYKSESIRKAIDDIEVSSSDFNKIFDESQTIYSWKHSEQNLIDAYSVII